MIAAATGREANVEFLIGAGADPLLESASGYNAWMYAAAVDTINIGISNPEVSYSD